MEITINLEYNFSAYAPGGNTQTKLEGETEHTFFFSYHGHKNFNGRPRQQTLESIIPNNDNGVELYYAIQKEVTELSNDYLDFNFDNRGGLKNFHYYDSDDERVNGCIYFYKERANSKTAEIICKTWTGNDYLFDQDLISDKTYTLETKDYTLIKITDHLKETV